MARQRHTTPEIEQSYHFDDKNNKAMWEAQGGEPLYMLPRFKMIRMRLLMLCGIWMTAAIIAAFTVFTYAPPERIMATTLFLGAMALSSVFPAFMSIMNYKSDDYVVFWIGFLSNLAAIIIGFSADFILEYVILPRAMYGKANASS